jgi:hypothetical protein
LSAAVPSGGIISYLKKPSNPENSPDNQEFVKKLSKKYPCKSEIMTLISWMESATSDIEALVAIADDKEVLWSLYLFVLSTRTENSLLRQQLVKIRLYSFFILMHSKLSAKDVEDILASGQSFVSDMVTLSDCSNQFQSSFSLEDSIILSHLCLENVLGLMESQLHRRSSLHLSTNILELLSLNDMAHSASSTSNEETWISIIQSACSLSSSFLRPSQSVQVTDTQWSLTNADQEILAGRFIRLGLELYAVALTTREPAHVISDIRVVNALTNLLSQFFEEVDSLIHSSNDCLTTREVQVLILYAKILYCMEITAEKSGYLEPLRDCHGLERTIDVLQSFAKSSCSIDELFGRSSYLVAIVDTAISTVRLSIHKQRESAILNRTLQENGYQFFYGNSFYQLGINVFQQISWKTDGTWVGLISLIRDIIDFDPLYLAQFLASPLSEAFKEIFSSRKLFTIPTNEDFRIDYDNMILSLSRFAEAICITSEGKRFLTESGIITCIIEFVQNPLLTLPTSYGMTADKLAALGVSFAQIIGDCEEAKVEIKNQIKSKFSSVLNGLKTLSIEMTDEEFNDLSLDSPRLQFLQRLSNLCLLLESIFTEIRGHQNDFVKDVLGENVGLLVSVYQYCLPPPKQFLAQMSLSSVTSNQLFGIGQCGKTITSLLKSSTLTLQQDFLSIVLSQIDETLLSISDAREVLLKINELGTGTRNTNNPQTHIVGLLDFIPDMTVCNPDCQEFLVANPGFEKTCWLILSGVSKMEWLCLMLSHSLRALYRNPTLFNHPQWTTWKESLRRLFSFLKSAAMETARLSSMFLQPKVSV